jgi:hypothetical protein
MIPSALRYNFYARPQERGDASRRLGWHASSAPVVFGDSASVAGDEYHHVIMLQDYQRRKTLEGMKAKASEVHPQDANATNSLRRRTSKSASPSAATLEKGLVSDGNSWQLASAPKAAD